MSLITILNEMEANRPNAEMDVQLGSENTYRARIGLKKAAAETVSRLERDYRKELMSSTVFIVATGSGREAFTELATSDTFGCFATNPDDFYLDLSSRIDPSLFGREGVKHLFKIASNILEDKAMELDIESYNMLQFNEKYNRGVKNAEDFALLVREAITDQVGSEIVGLNAVHSIVKTAISKKHSASVTPVILSTSDEKFALELYNNLKSHKDKNGEKRGLTPNVLLVVAGKASKDLGKSKDVLVVKNVSQESVGEALTSIRNRL